MKNLSILFVVWVLLSGCAPSEKAIQEAIAETQASSGTLSAAVASEIAKTKSPPVLPSPTTAIPTSSAATIATMTAGANDATQTAFATDLRAEAPPPYNTWRVAWFDSFTDNRAGWDIGASSNDYYDGNTAISAGKFIWQVEKIKSAEGFFAWKYGSQAVQLSDFYASVEARESSGPANDCSGLYFRGSGLYYYLFEVCQGGNYNVSRRQPGRTFPLSSRMKSDAINVGGMNKLAVAAQGSKFEFYVNDQLIETIKDGNQQSGFVGIIVDVYGGASPTFEFDNLVVLTP